MKKWVFVAFLLCSGSVFACSQLPATTAFIVINDKDGDLMLNQQEWLHARLVQNLKTNFKLNDLYEFFRLDYDGNLLIEAREIGFHNVVYLQEPCQQRTPNRFLLRKGKSHQ